MVLFKEDEIMKSFDEWMWEKVESHPLWWRVYDAMIKLDSKYMKRATEVEAGSPISLGAG